MPNANFTFSGCLFGLLISFTPLAARAELSANITLTNNYLWRGLTQSTNEAAIQGGIDYSHDSGFYAGTWASNIQYDADDIFSYEHDLYLGFAGSAGGLDYDLGYGFYRFGQAAAFDTSEVYAILSRHHLSLSLYLTADTEAREAPGQDFGFGKTWYLAADYSFPLENGTEIKLHAGYHEGDFAEAFNGITEGYMDYNLSINKDGFSFMISNTTLNSDGDNDGEEDYANLPPRDNDELKFALSYTLNVAL